MQERIKKLKNQIEELESFMEEIKRQQLRYPIDKISQEVLCENILTKSNVTVEPYNLGTYDESTTITINDKLFLLDTTKFVEFAN